MRVNLTPVPSKGDMEIKVKAGASIDSLKEGDIVKAQVISNEKGSVTMKTDSGYVFRARLEADVQLLQGNEVQLEVTGKEKGIVTLSIIGADEKPSELNGEAAGQNGNARELTDKSLMPYMSKLAKLNMPVMEDTARLMRELISRNPGMTLDEAAFLASNKLTGDENLIKAALAALSGGEKMDTIIKRLLTLLSIPESSTEFGIRNSEFGIDGQMSRTDGLTDAGGFGIRNSEFGVDGLTPRVEASLVSPTMLEQAHNLPLEDWLMRFAEGVSGENEAAGRALQMPSLSMERIITQTDTIMQSINVENVENNDENIQSGFQTVEQTLLAESKNQTSPTTSPTTSPSTSPTTSPSTSPTPDLQLPIQARDSVSPSSDSPLSALVSQLAAQTDAATSLNHQHSSPVSELAELRTVLANLLSEMPEFRDTPASALERFSNMLLKVANDSVDTVNGDTDKLAILFDKLFARIGKNDNGNGERLKSAREELYIRLALLEEEISHSNSPVKAEMAEQTHRFMEHVCVLNNIDQFVYMQLPVKIGEERKAAELYMFKKKGGKRPDPENVNILLALDLENMGHWEALINFRNKDVSIHMEVPGEKEKKHFSENTVMLHEMLAEAGFKLVNTDIKYLKKETTPLTALSTLESHISGRSGMIDYFI